MSSIAEPRIRFFTGAHGQRIAYAIAGNGPPLILPAWWVSHVERDGQTPSFRHFFERLASQHTVIRYDRPGVGLSARERSEWNLKAEVAQLTALIDHLDFERFSLLGFSCGGPAAVTYSATHPDRIERLILVGSYANGSELGALEFKNALMDLIRANWGLGAKTISDLMAPDLPKDEIKRQAGDQKASCSAEVAARLLGLSFEMDCTQAATEVEVPTLVIHRRDDQTVRLDAGRGLAALIPDADLRVVEGDAHVPWEGDGDAIADVVLEFLGGASEETPAAIAADDCWWRREGELWLIRFAGEEVRVAHRKGMQDLALLLAHPMRELPASELMGGAGETADQPRAGADPVLDSRARDEYAERARSLEAEIEEAEARNDLGRVDALREERELLLEELSRATGLGGRARRLGDQAERARKAVSARIRDAIRRVAEVHPGLGEHLETHVTTGSTCAYRPEPVRLWRS